MESKDGGDNEYTIKGTKEILQDARFADYGLKQKDLEKWTKPAATAVTAATTKNDMEEIKKLFDALAAAASAAQGDRVLTNEYIKEITKLNVKLQQCLDILLNIITQLMAKDSDSIANVEKLKATIQNAPDLNLIKEELTALTTYISSQEVDRGALVGELQQLANQIKKMCDRGKEFQKELTSRNDGRPSSEAPVPSGWTEKVDKDNKTY